MLATTNIRARSVLVVAMSLLTVGCNEAIMPRNYPRAMAPKYAVGDTWKADTGRTGQVKQVQDDGTVMFNSWLGFIGGAPAYRWTDGAVEEIGATNDNTTGRRGAVLMGAGWQFLSFPLEVGKEWQSSGEGFGPGPDGGKSQRHHHYTIRCKVWSYEDVHTQAGTFKAFRMTIEWGGLTPGYSFRDAHIFWWAPEVKFMVKERSTRSSWELASYDVRVPGSVEGGP